MRFSYFLPIQYQFYLAQRSYSILPQVRRVTGVIEIDREEERFLGIEASFWIAVALTYLDFLEDREVSGLLLLVCG